MSVSLLSSIANSYGRFEAIFSGNRVPDLFRVFKDIVGSCTDATKACVCLRLYNLCSAEAPEALLQFNDFLPIEYAFIEKGVNKENQKPLVILPKALEEHSRICPNDHGAIQPQEPSEDGNALMHTIENLLPSDSSLEFKHLIIAFSSQKVEAIEFIMYSTYLMKEYPELLSCLMFYLTPSWKKFSYTSLNIIPLANMGYNYGLSQNLQDDEYMKAILNFVLNPSVLSQEAIAWRSTVITAIESSLTGMMVKSPKLFEHTRAVVLGLMNDGRTKEAYQYSDDQHHQSQQNKSMDGANGGTGVTANGSLSAPARGGLGKASAKEKSSKSYKLRSGYGARNSENWSLGRNTISIMRNILAYDGGSGAEFKNLAELSHHTEQYFNTLLHSKELPRHAILSSRIPCCKLFLGSVCESLLNSNFVPLMKDSYAASKMQKYGLMYTFMDRGVVDSNFESDKSMEMDKLKCELGTEVDVAYFEQRQRYVEQLQAFMERYVLLPPSDQYLLITRKHNEAITFIEHALFCQLKYDLRELFSLAALNEQNDSRTLSYIWQLSSASYIKANSQVNYPCKITADDSYLVYMQLTYAMHVKEITEAYPSIALKNCKGLLAQRINDEIFKQYSPYIRRKILNTRDVYENFLFFSNERNFDAIFQLSQSWANASGYNYIYSNNGNYTLQNIHTNNLANIQHTAHLAEAMNTGSLTSYSQWFTQTGDLILPLDIPVMGVATEHDLTTFEMRLNRPSMDERSKISAINVPECDTSYRFKHPVRISRPDSVLNKYYYGIFPMGSESSARSIRQMNVSQLMEDNRKIVQSTDDIAGLEEELIKYDVFIYNLKIVESQLQVFCSRNCPNLLRVECARYFEGGNDSIRELNGREDDVIFETINQRYSGSAEEPEADKKESNQSLLMDSSFSESGATLSKTVLESNSAEPSEPVVKMVTTLSTLKVQIPNSLGNADALDANVLVSNCSIEENSDPIHGKPDIPAAEPQIMLAISKDELSNPSLAYQACINNPDTDGNSVSVEMGLEKQPTVMQSFLPDSPIASHISSRFPHFPQEANIYPLTPMAVSTHFPGGSSSSSSHRSRGKISTIDIQREVTKDMELGRSACLDLPLPCLETVRSVIGVDYYELFLRYPKTSAPFVLKRLRVFLRDLQNHRNFNQSPLIMRKLKTCSLRNLDHLSNGQAELDKKAFIVRNVFTDFEIKQQSSFHISDLLFELGHYNVATSEFLLDPKDDGTITHSDAQQKFYDTFNRILDSCPTTVKFWYDEEQSPEERFKIQKTVSYEQLLAILISQNFPGCYCSCVDRLSNTEETPLSDTALVLLNKLKVVLDALYAQLRQKPGFCTKPAQHKCYFLPHVVFNIRHFKTEALQFLRLWLVISLPDSSSYSISGAPGDNLQEAFFNSVFDQIISADRSPDVDESQSVCIIEFMTYVLLRFTYSILTRLSIARQLCEEVRPGISAENLQLEVLRKFGLVEPLDSKNPINSYEYSTLYMSLLNALPGNIANCTEMDQTSTQSLGLYFSDKEISSAVEAAQLSSHQVPPSCKPSPNIENKSTSYEDFNRAPTKPSKTPRTDLYWLIVQWYILNDKISQEQFEFDMSALLGSSIAVIFNLKTIMRGLRKIYNDIFAMYVEVHRIYTTNGIFKSHMIDANTINAILLYIQKFLKVDMLVEQSGELRSRLLLSDIANKRGSGIMLCEVVAGCMCFTELFDVKPMP